MQLFNSAAFSSQPFDNVSQMHPTPTLTYVPLSTSVGPNASEDDSIMPLSEPIMDKNDKISTATTDSSSNSTFDEANATMLLKHLIGMLLGYNLCTQYTARLQLEVNLPETCSKKTDINLCDRYNDKLAPCCPITKPLTAKLILVKCGRQTGIFRNW
jgi:hypothetical protein